MQNRIYASFTHLNTAKKVLGRIKKNSWNRADLSVIYADPSEPRTEDSKYEMAVEGFIENNLPKNPNSRWPGLKTAYLDGVGAVNYASPDGKGLAEIIADHPSELVNELASAKTVAVIDTDPELVPELRMILESNGAEIILSSE